MSYRWLNVTIKGKYTGPDKDDIENEIGDFLIDHKYEMLSECTVILDDGDVTITGRVEMTEFDTKQGTEDYIMDMVSQYSDELMIKDIEVASVYGGVIDELDYPHNLCKEG